MTVKKWNVYVTHSEELEELCTDVRQYACEGQYERCEEIITEAMEKFPHAAQPHNLLGILLEKRGEHLLAMRHFRAAWDLDPSYLPARQNLETFGTLYSHGSFAYDESDCWDEKQGTIDQKIIQLSLDAADWEQIWQKRFRRKAEM